MLSLPAQHVTRNATMKGSIAESNYVHCACLAYRHFEMAEALAGTRSLIGFPDCSGTMCLLCSFCSLVQCLATTLVVHLLVSCR
jgi:hypothetical protein